MKVKWQMAWLYLNEFWEASIVLGMEKVTTLLLLKLLVLMTSLSAAIFMSSVISSSVGVAVWIDISSSEAKGGPTKKDQINLDSHYISSELSSIKVLVYYSTF